MSAERTRMEAAIDRLRALQDPEGDTEHQHQLADEILCELLEYVGARHLVAEWRKVPKWYA